MIKIKKVNNSIKVFKVTDEEEVFKAQISLKTGKFVGTTEYLIHLKCLKDNLRFEKIGKKKFPVRRLEIKLKNKEGWKIVEIAEDRAQTAWFKYIGSTFDDNIYFYVPNGDLYKEVTELSFDEEVEEIRDTWL